MNTKNILYLASGSRSRQDLLKKSAIRFEVIPQRANESYGDLTSLEEIVSFIAKQKMEHVLLPQGKSGEIRYVLTADTLCEDSFGKIHAKPLDFNEAIEQIKSISSGTVIVATGYCLEKKAFDGSGWKTTESITQVVSSECEFDIPDNWINNYIKQVDVLSIAGSIAIEDYGAQFLKIIKGSYSAIIGLPMFEVRNSLEKLGFY